MKCQDCHSFGEVEAGYFNEQAGKVLEKLEGEEDIEFSIIAIDDTEQCSDAFEQIPVKDRDDFLETCRGTDTSVSFRSGGQEFIIIKTDKEFLYENPEALRGLLAHELMHTVQRDDDLEKKVEDGAKRYEEEMIDSLKDSGLTDEEINRFIHTIFQTAIYTLKDIFTNTDLIEQGFVEELEAYYHHMLGIETFCPAPDFYGETKGIDDIQDAITFELGILPAWLPFKALDRERSNRIRERIEECYEQDIPEVADYVHRLEELYADTYAESEDFIDAYFQQVVQHSIELMEGAEG